MMRILGCMVIALFMTGVLTAPVVDAREIPELQRFLKEEITKLNTAEPNVGGGTYESYDYRLSLFRLRIAAEFGFDVGIAKVTLVPVAEFFWE